jgi:hypothetical protein
LAVQVFLGVGSYLSRFSSVWIPGGQLTMLVAPVAHRLVGALILAGTVVLAVRAGQVTRWLSPAARPRLAAGLSR